MTPPHPWLGECTFVPNRDYNPGGTSAQIMIASSHYRMDRAACCASCGSTDGCAAAVFRGADCSPWASLCRGHCTFRTEEDLLHPVQATDNSSACVPTGKQPTPTITINATVPGVSRRRARCHCVLKMSTAATSIYIVAKTVSF